MKRQLVKYVVGIDEVGRGALAGPVVVAAVCFPSQLRVSNRKLGALKDSKKLSPKMRGLWTEHFKSMPEIVCKTARVYPRAIEKINISEAANRAAGSAFERLIEQLGIKESGCRIFLDGGLYLGNKRNPSTSSSTPSSGHRGSGRMIVKTIIRGDEKITAIKVASVIAKVQRDKYMKKLSRIYPAYGFEIHKGYGTRSHRRAIKKHGASEVHRLTFLKKRM